MYQVLYLVILLANSADFKLNHRVVLGLQMSGNGRKEAAFLSGMMNINCNPMGKQWMPIQEGIGKAIIDIGKEVIEENLVEEMKLSETNAAGKSVISVARDARWDKRGSGRRKDSLSGCSVFN